MVPMGGSFYFGLNSRLPDISSAFYFRGTTTFHEHYMDYFTVNFTEMLTHVRGTRPLFLRLLRPGYEATLTHGSCIEKTSPGISFVEFVY